MLLIVLIFQLNLYICSISSSSISTQDLERRHYDAKSSVQITSTPSASTFITARNYLFNLDVQNQRTRTSSAKALKMTSSITSQLVDSLNDDQQGSMQTNSFISTPRDNKMPMMFNRHPALNSSSNMITSGDIVDNTISRNDETSGLLEDVEMYTNNHQSMSNDNSANGNGNSNSRYYDNHHYYYQFGSSNPNVHNKYTSSHQVGGSSHKNSHNNLYPNNFNLNYIHSLLMRPASHVSSSTSLLNLYANNNFATGSSSSPPPSTGSGPAYVSASSSLFGPIVSQAQQQTLAHKNKPSFPQASVTTQAPQEQQQQQLKHQQSSTNQTGVGDFPNADICGRQQAGYREPRIVGGNHTYEGEFPWAVSIQRHGNHHCGGVIVGRRWILTAAHCVRSQLVGNLIIRTGGQTLTRSGNSLSGHLERDHSVEQIVMHDDFSRYDNLTASQMKSSANTNNADIALLKLKNDIHWNELVWPVCFPSKGSGNFSGHDAIVIGWGKLNEKSEDFSNELQKVKLTIIDNKVCQNWFRQAGREMPIDERIICAGFKNGGKDACHGDSGGPLLSRINGQYVVVGVVSTGIGCARPLLPGLYSRVSSYIGWIEKYVID